MTPDDDGAPTPGELLAGEISSAGGPVTVPIGDVPGGAAVTVPPITAWPGPAFDALRFGDYETWAELVLDDPSFEAWTAADLTVDDCADFLDDWSRRSGQDLHVVFRLADLIGRYGRQLEGDLWLHFRLDLRDLWQPAGGPSRLTWRLLDVLIERLPGESALKTAIRDDMPPEQISEVSKTARKGHGPWSHSDLLTADVIDLLKWLIFATYAAQGGKPDRPKPYPRPGVGQAKPRRLASPQLNYLQRLRAQHEAEHGDTSGRTVIPFPTPGDTETG